MKQHLAVVALASALAAAAAAQEPTQLLPARQSRAVVTSQGSAVEEREGRAARAPLAGSHALTAPGLAWSHSDGGLGWIGTAVSIGERGTQVLAEYDLNSETAELFSCFDADPPSAVWSNPAVLGTELRMLASADECDTHVAIDQVVVGGNPATRQAVVYKYSSSSPVPEWTYTFAPLINSVARIAIARDGRTIAAAVTNESTFEIEIAVWGPASSAPGAYIAVPVGNGNYLRGFDLSADGSTLYVSAGTRAYVLDLATQAVVFDTDIGASFDSHAISGDGGVFAFGSFFVMRVWERSGATYLNTHTVVKAGEVYCSRLDVSDDGSTVAAGWYYYNPGLQVTIEAFDVPTKTVTMSQTLVGVGGFQNQVADVVCSADGRRFAVGLWGDAGTIDELRIYDRDQTAPVASLDTPGSIFDVDLSADGQRAVAASKAVHANSNGNGGRIDLLDAGGEDLELFGTPTIGEQVEFRIHGPPSKVALLLTASAAANPPVTYPGGIGTLHIERATLTFQVVGPIQPSGWASLVAAIPAEPELVGTSLFHQGLLLAPRQLTADWLKLTVLP